jgi:UDPglucose 6-dehydrogenase
MKITVIGTGYVGSVTSAIFAHFGNDVWAVDIDKEKVQRLTKGKVPFYEPGLEEIIKKGVDQGKLHFTTSYQEAVPDSEVIFICVGTPPKENGDYDLSYVLASAESIAKNLNNYAVVTIKSTVPPGTNKEVKKVIDQQTDVDYNLASCPEFLREGSAVDDSLNPDRVVIGADHKKAEKKLLELHEPLEAPRLVCDIKSAQMIKYASNAFLATKISFINFLARICDQVGADINQVSRGLGMDHRISPSFFNAGIGYGGSCFPKDTWALIRFAERMGLDFKFLKQVDNVNEGQVDYFIKRAEEMLDNNLKGRKVTVLGLSFKPETDDMRSAQSISIIKKLTEKGAEVIASDPVAIENARKLFPQIKFAENPYQALEKSDLLMLVTEWDQYQRLDFKKVKKVMKSPNVLDGRNIYDPDKLSKQGFNYSGVGRGQFKYLNQKDGK